MNPLERNDAFFQGMHGTSGAEQRAARDAARQETYEARQVLRFFQEAGCRLGRAMLESRAKHDTGESQITFDWFRTVYPRFPVVLFTEKMPYVHEIDVPQLFTRFTQLKFFSAFVGHCQAEGIDLHKRTAGLIFEWPGLGATVLHNMRRHAQRGNDDAFQDGGTLIVRTIGSPPVTYVLESLKTFIPAIGRDWVD